MLYSSRNGCFYYYDSILFRWHIAEPTLLFLLGLESITSYDKSISDSIVISKYVYKTYIDKVDPLEHIDDVYDDIYSFLSKIGSVEDYEHYLKFNCYGLKLLLNDMTGTGDDRTVPFIFKYDANKSLVDPAKELDTNSKLSFYDIQAQHIYNVFNDIGYDTSCDKTILDNGKIALRPEYYIDRTKGNIRDILDSLKDVDNKPLRTAIINNILTYNAKVNAVHEKRIANSEIYKLLDYKAMYAYALGVLYGCRCLGFDDSVIWRLDPKLWYNDVYFNLVRTAWYVFRFHWSYELEDVALDMHVDPSLEGDAKEAAIEAANKAYSEKYQGIQDNKIWNFNNDSSLIKAAIAQDETNCFCLYLNNKQFISESTINKDYLHTVSESIIYSFSTQPDSNTSYGNTEYEHPGSYLLKYMSLKDGRITWKWSSIDSKVSDEVPLKGVVSTRDSSMTRYIGNDPVILYRAYKYKDSDNNTKYLAPKYDAGNGDYRYKKYYVYTGDLGWVDYTEDLLLDISQDKLHPDYNDYSRRHNYLDIVPKTPSFNSLKFAFPKDSKLSGDSPFNSLVTYYKCYVTDKWTADTDSYGDNDSDILYGVYNKWVQTSDTIPTNFDRIISKALFDAQYSSEIEAPDGNTYEVSAWYDLDVALSLVTRDIDGIHYVWKPVGDSDTNANVQLVVNTDDNHQGKSTYYYGYSKTPSSLLQLYNLHSTTVTSESALKQPHTETFRFYIYTKEGTTKVISNNYTYWSEDYFKSIDGDNQTNRTWRDINELEKTSLASNNPLYSLANESTNIYKGEIRVISNTSLYNIYTDKVTSSVPSALDEFIYGDSHFILGLSSGQQYRFMLVGDTSNTNTECLYAKGMTKYLCPFVLTDDDGNSLLDDNGKPLVWYDPKNEQYWNGLYNINSWQKEKPNRNSKPTV